MLSVYMWEYFCSAYIRCSNVSVFAGSGCYSAGEQRAHSGHVSSCLKQNDVWWVFMEMMTRVQRGWCCEFGNYAGCAWGMDARGRARGAARWNGGAPGSVCSGHGVVPKIGWLTLICSGVFSSFVVHQIRAKVEIVGGVSRIRCMTLRLPHGFMHDLLYPHVLED